MQSPELPHHYLERDGSITPQELRKLQAQAQAVRTDPQTGETIYGLGQNPIWGGYHLTITVNPDKDAYVVSPRLHCQCQQLRHPLDCECVPVDCSKCHLRLTGLTVICGMELCLYDQCPACLHYRETCFSEELITSILQQATTFRNSGMSDAMALTSAVSDVLGAHSGSSPIFPVTERAIGRSDRLLNREGQGHDTVWTFQDRSVITPDPMQHIWLESRD